MMERFTPLENVRPDLKRYYKPELNDGKLMSEVSANRHKKIVLCCDKCNTTQSRLALFYTRNTAPFECEFCNSLGIKLPNLAKQWHPTKNSKSVFEVSSNSPRLKYWWKCSEGHEWQATTAQRNSMNAGCPYCSGYYITKNNSLARNHPELVAQWSEKNGTFYDIATESKKKLWWRCEKGHEWRAVVKERVIRNDGCPFCAKHNFSKGEKAIIQLLDETKIQYKAQYCVVINDHKRKFDLYIPKLNLFIEVHGKQHFEDTGGYFIELDKQQEIDRQKQKYAEQHGHYMMVDYREHDPKLALDRFFEQFIMFLEDDSNF